MDDYVSIAEGAKSLGLSESRVRAMAERGGLGAEKVAGRWLLQKQLVNECGLTSRPSGRPLEPHNAWALILDVSGSMVPGVDPSVRSRLRRAVREVGIEGLEPRLRRRAEIHDYFAHPGELSRMVKDKSLVLSGVSAAAHVDADVLPGAELDGYVSASQLDQFVKRHALARSKSAANVKLRVVPANSWHFLEGLRIAPSAAVGLDLSEDPDPRLSRAGASVLKRLDSGRDLVG